MQEVKDIVHKLYNSHLAEPDLFLVDLEVLWAKKKRITLVLDSDQPLTIERCVEVSRKLNALIDEAITGEEAYDLEVTSPGADQPIRLLRQFPKHIGREFKVLLRDESTLQGKLETVHGEILGFMAEEELPTDPSKKKAKPQKHLVLQEVPFTDIVSATIVLAFK